MLHLNLHGRYYCHMYHNNLVQTKLCSSYRLSWYFHYMNLFFPVKSHKALESTSEKTEEDGAGSWETLKNISQPLFFPSVLSVHWCGVPADFWLLSWLRADITCWSCSSFELLLRMSKYSTSSAGWNEFEHLLSAHKSEVLPSGKQDGCFPSFQHETHLGSAVVVFSVTTKKQLDVAHGNTSRLKSVPPWTTDWISEVCIVLAHCSLVLFCHAECCQAAVPGALMPGVTNGQPRGMGGYLLCPSAYLWLQLSTWLLLSRAKWLVFFWSTCAWNL